MHLSTLALLLLVTFQSLASAAVPSIADFHHRAEKGERLNVVFLGGSVTWGANASDPQRTSWRGRMMAYLVEKYPKSSFLFTDAAIGGTGSNLGLFRIDRDVLPRDPDLVFLDCTVNDNADGKDEESLATYERVLRDLLNAPSAVFPVLLCFRDHVVKPDAPVPARHEAHRQLTKAYNLPTGDTLAGIREGVRTGKLKPEELWAFAADGAHPDDSGYQAMFEAIRDGFEKGIASGLQPAIPEKTVFTDLYPHRQRQILVEGSLPTGWSRSKTRRTAMWFDGLSSRWMGDVAAAQAKDGQTPAALEVKFRGSLVGLFGERDAITAPFRVWVDGQPLLPKGSKSPTDDLWKTDTQRMSSPTAGGGQLFSWIVLAANLPDGVHTLRIEPDFSQTAPGSEFRIESVCSAGR